jgi:HrpA-like RNA helicase
MSATLDASKFADYFKRDGGAGAPALHIPVLQKSKRALLRTKDP